MKRFVLCLLLLSLSGCANQHTSTETIADSAKENVAAFYDGLPKECKTDINKKQKETIQKEIDAIVQSCNDQKEIITQEKVRWKYSFFSLLLVVGIWIARKITK